jgi:hypothetical protein
MQKRSLLIYVINKKTKKKQKNNNTQRGYPYLAQLVLLNI